MYLRFVLCLIAIFISLSCNSNPTDTSSGGSIDISYPNNTTEWEYQEAGTYVEWTGATGSEVMFEIYKNGTYMGLYHGWTDNDGYAGRTAQLDASWTAGTGYQLKAIDRNDNYGWSDSFSIVGGGSGGSIDISYPNNTTEWEYQEAGTYVEWTGATGSEVMFEIYKNGTYMGLYHGWTDNDGYAGRTAQLDASWTAGTGYQLKAIDRNDNYGWSDSFSIVGGGSGGSIDISYPNNTTEWEYQEAGTYVEWTGATGSEVMFEIYKNGTYMGLYHGWTDNDGYAGRTAQLDASWTADTGYQLKAIDRNDNYGWSDSFSIVNNTSQ